MAKPIDDRFNQQDMSNEIEALLAEIADIDPGPHPNSLVFTPEQDACLVALRKKGLSWPKIEQWWRAHGFKGCADILSKHYRELVRDS